jgi:hypothetical protein
MEILKMFGMENFELANFLLSMIIVFIILVGQNLGHKLNRIIEILDKDKT